MRQKTARLFATLLLLCSPTRKDLFAQSAFKVLDDPNPKVNFIYYSVGPVPEALEGKQGWVKAKTNVMGFGTPQYIIEGERSPVRIKAGDSLQFMIKPSQMVDPGKILKLYKFIREKGNRMATINTGGPFSAFGKKNKSTKGEIAFTTQKKGNDTYLIRSVEKLAPGEYGFQNLMLVNGTNPQNTSYTFLMFGIDE